MAADSVLRIQRRNVLPSTAIPAAGSATSPTQNLTVGKGLRFYIYSSAVTASTSPDSVSLLAVPPNGAAPVPIGTLAGQTSGSYLTVAGTVIVDFYPGSTTSQPPPGGAGVAATFNIGVLAVSVPKQWQIKVQLGTAGVATIAIDCEVLP